MVPTRHGGAGASLRERTRNEVDWSTTLPAKDFGTHGRWRATNDWRATSHKGFSSTVYTSRRHLYICVISCTVQISSSYTIVLW